MADIRLHHDLEAEVDGFAPTLCVHFFKHNNNYTYNPQPYDSYNKHMRSGRVYFRVCYLESPIMEIEDKSEVGESVLYGSKQVIRYSRNEDNTEELFCCNISWY